jgi:hypothetical protein
MKYLRTIIKFEGDFKTTLARMIKEFLTKDFLAHEPTGKKKSVYWTDSHELTVIHKEGRKKGESK